MRQIINFQFLGSMRSCMRTVRKIIPSFARPDRPIDEATHFRKRWNSLSKPREELALLREIQDIDRVEVQHTFSQRIVKIL